jgi:YgiT-type zinc finger domain-containing protein
MNPQFAITICPNCGSDRIQKVRRSWTEQFQGQTYTVPMLEFHECPNCGEKVYDRQAMRQIESCSPAFAKKRVTADSPVAAADTHPV